MRLLPFLGTTILQAVLASTAFAQAPASQPHNVVLFIADGLRFPMVDDQTAPTMAAIARDGVRLRNSHALFPTFTTANASAMATGHMIGDTGDFSNTIYAGFEVPGAGNSLTPFLESDAVLGDVDEHYSGNYLDEATILKLARDKGYSTASVGKIGPALIFDPTERTGNQTVLVDDATGTPKGIPLSAEMTDRIKAAGLPLTAPTRGANGAAGDVTKPGTLSANVVQQDYFAAVTTRAVLPMFKERNNPFVLVFWSRDPDGSQHNQGDSLNMLVPGINGATSLAAIRNADDDLARIRSTLNELGLLDTTDIIVTSDHGFSTISKKSQTSSTVKTKFADALEGHLPLGFVALDLAHALNMPLIDPDDGYKTVEAGQHTKNGNGLIGGDRNKPKVVVAANGGSDLIYLPDGDKALAKQIVDMLLTQDYVSGIFVEFKTRQISRHFNARRHRARRQCGDAVAGDRDQLPLLRHGVRRAGALHGRSRRYGVAARPGHARLVQPRRYLEFHGHGGTGFQIAIHRSGARQQRRSGPHHRAAGAARCHRQGQACWPRPRRDAAERRSAGSDQPCRDVESRAQRAHDGDRYADGRGDPIFRRRGISWPHGRLVDDRSAKRDDAVKRPADALGAVTCGRRSGRRAALRRS